MDHEYYKDRLSAFLDRELTPEEMHMMRQHVDDCADCRAVLASLEKLDRLVIEQSGLAEADYWEQAAQRIEARVDAVSGETPVTEVGRTGNGLWWKITAAAASVAFLTFIGLHQYDILDRSTVESDAPAVMAPAPTPPSKGTRIAVEGARRPQRLEAERTEADEAPASLEPSEAWNEETRAAAGGAEPGASAPAESDIATTQAEAPAPAQEKPPVKLEAPEEEAPELTLRAPAKPMAVDEFRASKAAENKDAVAGRTAQSIEMSKFSVNAETALPRETTPTSVETLRARRDSLTALVAAPPDHVPGETAASLQAPSADSAALAVELTLLETWNELAQAGDSSDAAGARAFFEQYLAQPQARFRELAGRYLEELTRPSE